jgi:hypothetical protein
MPVYRPILGVPANGLVRRSPVGAGDPPGVGFATSSVLQTTSITLPTTVAPNAATFWASAPRSGADAMTARDDEYQTVCIMVTLPPFGGHAS